VSLLKRLVPVLLLCLLIWAQSAALSPEHQRHHPAGQGCLLCIAGPLAFVRSGPPALIAPVVATNWIEPAARPEPSQSLFVSTLCPRGPPA
jgi:hypothetical protein